MNHITFEQHQAAATPIPTELLGWSLVGVREACTATMTAQQFAGIHDVPINKNGVIVGPHGIIYQRPEGWLSFLYRKAFGLPNREPLICQMEFCTFVIDLRRGAEAGPDYALRQIGFDYWSSRKHRLREFEWTFEFELTRTLNVLCTKQKCIVCGEHKRGDKFDSYSGSRLKEYCRECDPSKRTGGQ